MPQNLAAFLATQDTKMLWEVVSAPNPKIAEMLLTGEVDLAAMEWPLSHAAVSAKAWAREEMVIILPPDHAFATRSEITFEELKTLRILGGERGTGTGTLLNDALGPQAAELNTVGNLGSTEAVKRAVAAGLGASIVLGALGSVGSGLGGSGHLPLEGQSADETFLPRHSQGQRRCRPSRAYVGFSDPRTRIGRVSARLSTARRGGPRDS